MLFKFNRTVVNTKILRNFSFYYKFIIKVTFYYSNCLFLNLLLTKTKTLLADANVWIGIWGNHIQLEEFNLIQEYQKVTIILEKFYLKKILFEFKFKV